MEISPLYSHLLTQIEALFSEGPAGQWQPHATVQELLAEQLDHNSRQEVPEDPVEVLQRLQQWMAEQLELTRYLAQQTSPEGRAAGIEATTRQLDAELAAMLATAEACHHDNQ